MTKFRSTTVLLVRRDNKVCLVSDGQVTVQDTVVKSTASKVKRAGKGQVLVGFVQRADEGCAQSIVLGARIIHGVKCFFCPQAQFGVMGVPKVVPVDMYTLIVSDLDFFEALHIRNDPFPDPFDRVT